MHNQAFVGGVEGVVAWGKTGDIGKDEREQDGGERREGFGGHRDSFNEILYMFSVQSQVRSEQK